MAYCPPKPVLADPCVDKRVGAVLNYGFDLAPVVTGPSFNPWAPPPGKPVIPWLEPGELVIGFTVTFGPGSVSTTQDLVLIATQITANAAGVPASLLTAWISGGIAGNTYTATYAWTTNSSPIERQDTRDLLIVCIP